VGRDREHAALTQGEDSGGEANKCDTIGKKEHWRCPGGKGVCIICGRMAPSKGKIGNCCLPYQQGPIGCNRLFWLGEVTRREEKPSLTKAENT